MELGKYGKMILNNMSKNYPYRKSELEMSGTLQEKIIQREQYILKKKEQLESEIKKEYKEPKTNEMLVIAKYQQMIDGLVEEILMKEILKKI